MAMRFGLIVCIPHSRCQELTSCKVTNGNHTATESTFSSPCIPAHETDNTINGFDSGFRDTQPGTAGSILSVPILIQNENHTFWFFDYNTCGQGGVGVINNNESSSETLVGFTVGVSMLYGFLTPIFSTFWAKCLHIVSIFQRNAIRLNGTTSSDNATTTSYRASSTTSPSPSSSVRRSASGRTFAVGAMGVIPLFIAGLLV